MAKERMEPLAVAIPAVLFKRLRARRDTTGVTIKRIVADALRSELDKPYCVDGAEQGKVA
jgi:hypothetical protein